MTTPQTTRLPRFPVRPPPVYRCAAGVTPCDAPARPYPCGPRCDRHSPNALIRTAACVQPGTDGGPGLGAGVQG